MEQHGQAGAAAQSAPRVASTIRTLRAGTRRPRAEPPSAHRGAATEGGAIERLCMERGLRMTGQRRTIARVLSEASDHPDVEELYRRATLLDSGISIATVYRTVRLLEEKGILQRRDFGSGRARYEPTDHGHHYHLIDVETGKVVEFRNSEHERLVRALAEQLGFSVLSLRLEVFGKRLEPQPMPGRAAAAGERTNGGAR
jgi:Fur family transcriptional regulator, ferric uptake regulator